MNEPRMAQRRVPAVYMRGGTSRCLVFHDKDLPPAGAERDRILLAALGSPDPYGRQLNGLGGGISSLSKACIIGPPSRPDADVDYTFAQVEARRDDVGLRHPACCIVRARPSRVRLRWLIKKTPQEGGAKGAW
jgi:2-methylaconitate cis-trans-isomerase PrpF